MGCGTSKAANAAAPDAKAANKSPELTTSSAEKSGVTLKFLNWFADYVDHHLDTRAVVETIIKEQTKEKKCRYLEMLQEDEVGPPQVYVIHSWDREFHKMIKVLNKGLTQAFPDLPPEKIFVWIDAFAINQWGAAMQHQDLVNLQTAISSCQSAVLCLDTKGAALTRTWVLWELWMVSCTMRANQLLIMSGFVKGPDLVQKLGALDIEKNSFTSSVHDKALLVSSVSDAGHLADLTKTLRNLMLESARSSALTQEKASSAAKVAAAEMAEAVPAAKAAAETAAAALAAAPTTTPADGGASKAGASTAKPPPTGPDSDGAAGDTDTAPGSGDQGADLDGGDADGDAPPPPPTPEQLAEQAAAAAAAAQASADKARSLADETQLSYAMSVFRAAAILDASGMAKEAHDLYLASLDISNEGLGGLHTAVECATLSALAGTYKAAGQWDDAVDCLNKVVALDVQMFGADHVRTAKDKAALAVVLRRAGKTAQAAALYREALAVMAPEGVTPTKTIANVQMGLVSVLKMDKNLSEAEQLCRTALATFENVCGKDSPYTMGALAQLAQLVWRGGDKESAQDLIDDLEQRKLLMKAAQDSYAAQQQSEADAIKAEKQAKAEQEAAAAAAAAAAAPAAATPSVTAKAASQQPGAGTGSTLDELDMMGSAAVNELLANSPEFNAGVQGIADAIDGTDAALSRGNAAAATQRDLPSMPLAAGSGHAIAR